MSKPNDNAPCRYGEICGLYRPSCNRISMQEDCTAFADFRAEADRLRTEIDEERVILEEKW